MMVVGGGGRWGGGGRGIPLGLPGKVVHLAAGFLPLIGDVAWWFISEVLLLEPVELLSPSWGAGLLWGGGSGGEGGEGGGQRWAGEGAGEVGSGIRWEVGGRGGVGEAEGGVVLHDAVEAGFFREGEVTAWTGGDRGGRWRMSPDLLPGERGAEGGEGRW